MKNTRLSDAMSAQMVIDSPRLNYGCPAGTVAALNAPKSENYTTQQWRNEYIAIWRAWHKRGEIKLGYPSRSIGLASGYVSKSFDEFCEELDKAIAHAMDSIIEEELPPSQRAAMYHRYLHAVFHFPRGNYQECLNQALEAISVAMKRKGFA